MAKVFAIANQKGGVGKTTSCINLAASLVASQQRVLLIDLDPQGNATTGSGVDKQALEHSIYDVLIGQCDRRPRPCSSPSTAATSCCRPTATSPPPRSPCSTCTTRSSRLRQALAPIREQLRLHPHRLPAGAVDADRSTRWSPPTV